jgi:hypothetical protein
VSSRTQQINFVFYTYVIYTHWIRCFASSIWCLNQLLLAHGPTIFFRFRIKAKTYTQKPAAQVPPSSWRRHRGHRHPHPLHASPPAGGPSNASGTISWSPQYSSSRQPAPPICCFLAVRWWLPPPSPSPRRPHPPGPRYRQRRPRSPLLLLTGCFLGPWSEACNNSRCAQVLGGDKKQQRNGCRAGITRKVMLCWVFSFFQLLL